MCILPVNKTKEFREREAKNKPVKDYLQLQRDILHCDRVQFSFLFNLLLIIIQVVDFCGDGVHRDSFNGDGFCGDDFHGTSVHRDGINGDSSRGVTGVVLKRPEMTHHWFLSPPLDSFQSVSSQSTG